MDFNEWWDESREKYAKDYAMLGAFAIRKIALCAWEAGRAASKDASQPSVEADAVKPCGYCDDPDICIYNYCPRCGRKIRTA